MAAGVIEVGDDVWVRDATGKVLMSGTVMKKQPGPDGATLVKLAGWNALVPVEFCEVNSTIYGERHSRLAPEVRKSLRI